MTTKENKYVALLIETSSNYGRQLLRGILKFVRSHSESRWVTLLDQQDLNSDFASWPRDISVNGLITRSRSPQVTKWVDRLDVPCISLVDSEPGDPSSLDKQLIRSNDERIGQLAAEHLISLGFRNFGFGGYTREAWSTRRCKGFRDSIGQLKNFKFEMYHSANFLSYIQNYETEQDQIVDWLVQLPKPVGIMACNDLRGKQILDGCLQANLRVPDQVAVIGVDNDELLTNFCNPPLSSVVPNPEKIGFLAATRLDALMCNQNMEDCVSIVDPLSVHVRQSTDIVAIDDPDIADALRFMRDKAHHGITVEDVVQQSQISRSTLERRLKEFLGRTPQQELRRIQLNHVRQLLITTPHSIEEIANSSGFEHAEYLHVVFKKEFGVTPGEYRSQQKVN